MIRYFIGIFIVTIIVIVLIVFGFTLTGSPITARNQQFDQLRSTAINNISYQIGSYYTSKNQLPINLSDVNNQTGIGYTQQARLDPETSQPYTYQRVDGTNYKLCAIFKTNTLSSTKNQPVPLQIDNSNTLPPVTTIHPIGEFCFAYSVKPANRTTFIPSVSGSDNQTAISIQGQIIGSNAQKVRILSAKIIGKDCTVQTNDALVGAGSTTFTTSAKDFCQKGAIIFFVDGQAAGITTAAGSHCLTYEPGKAVANIQVDLSTKQDTTCQ